MAEKWNGKMKAVTFSYDDGVVQDIHLIELLNRYNLKCTFNLNSGRLGMGNFLHRADQRIAHYKVKPEHVKQIYEGHEVAVHTINHPMLPQLEDAEVIRQVEEDRMALEDLVGYDIVGMAYPGGGVNHDDRVADLIRNNTKMRYCRTILSTDSFDVQEDLHKLKPNVYHLKWDRMFDLANQFIALEADKPQMFYIWGHAYEMDFASENWVNLEKFFQLISNRDDIFYGTNAEVLL